MRSGGFHLSFGEAKFQSHFPTYPSILWFYGSCRTCMSFPKLLLERCSRCGKSVTRSSNSEHNNRYCHTHYSHIYTYQRSFSKRTSRYRNILDGLHWVVCNAMLTIRSLGTRAHLSIHRDVVEHCMAPRWLLWIVTSMCALQPGWMSIDPSRGLLRDLKVGRWRHWFGRVRFRVPRKAEGMAKLEPGSQQKKKTQKDRWKVGKWGYTLWLSSHLRLRSLWHDATDKEIGVKN